jgi:carboxyl-terminal processing protease
MTKTLSVLLLSLLLAAPSFAAITKADESKIEPTKIKAGGVIRPAPSDQIISRYVAHLLERSHYAQKRFDDEVSGAFLDRYLTLLDPQRLHLLASDIAEFEKFRTTLDELTMKNGDTTPAGLIFMRFRDRLRQRHAYINELLPKESFEFTTDETVLINRKDEPWPKDAAGARQLWRERLRYEILQEKLNKEKLPEIVKIITRRYDRTLRMFEEFDSDDVLQLYLTALAHVYDPHSDYFGKSQLENFQIQMRLALFGIGAVLTSEDGYCKIRELTPEGPAQKSKKLKPGDRIIAVAQGEGEPVDAVDMKLNKVVEMIRGAKGTEVRLTIIPEDAPDPSVRRVVSLVRDEIKLEDQQAKAKLIELPGEAGDKPLRVGVIDLPSFYADFEAAKGSPQRKSTTADVAVLIKKLKEEKVDGLMLDLRRNGGGSLEEAISLSGLFIKEGPIVQVRDPDGTVIADRDNDPAVLYDGPLVVMTSRFSASASEILAGALQDYGRAVIVGDEMTHGKGTVQSLVNLSQYIGNANTPAGFNPGALKVTIRKFYRASGASTQLRGIAPDIKLPSINNHAEVGESALDNPLPWDVVPAAPFEKSNAATPFLAELQGRSKQRVERDADFKYVGEEIARYLKLKDEKTVSLNEAKRRKETEEAEARTKARKAELAARPELDEKVYEITLKLATQPGLPPPLAKTNTTASANGEFKTLKPAKGVTLVVPSNNVAKSSTTDARAKAGQGEEAEEEAADTTPPLDIYFAEARNVLRDLIQLSRGNTRLSLQQATTQKP